MKNMINVTSKSIKNVVQNLNYIQLNNRNANFTAIIKQNSSSIDIELKKSL